METTGRGTPSPESSRGVTRTVDQASAGVPSAIDKVSDATRPIVDRAHQTVDKIAGSAVEAAETLGAKGEQLKNAQARAMEQCRGYVRENPLASLGIAIAAGFLLSRFF